ncbi:MAG: YlqD family protein, partial [Firmicutes bacterium]|nr:YlqD family protein [Bacillota bacterium]
MLTITRPVLVKVRVTDNYKKNLAMELRQTAARLELELQQIELQARKLQELSKKNPGGVEAALAQLEQEKQRRLDTRLKLLDKIKEVGKLENGSEVLQGKVFLVVVS